MVSVPSRSCTFFFFFLSHLLNLTITGVCMRDYFFRSTVCSMSTEDNSFYFNLIRIICSSSSSSDSFLSLSEYSVFYLTFQINIYYVNSLGRSVLVR